MSEGRPERQGANEGRTRDAEESPPRAVSRDVGKSPPDPKDEPPNVSPAEEGSRPVGGGAGVVDQETATSLLDRSGVVGFVGRNVRLVAVLGWLILSAIGSVQGPAFVVLLLAAGALILTISFFWSSVRTVLGETPLSGADAYVLAAPRAEEEQKQAVLRALKDLEFERSVGKISDEDYAVLVAKYRSEAKRLLRAIEDEAKPRRDRVENLVHARLVAAGLETGPATHRSVADSDGDGDGDSDNDEKAAAEERKPAATKPSKTEGKPKRKKSKSAEPPERTVEIEPLDEGSAKKNTDATWKSAPTLKTKESPAFAIPTRKCVDCGTRNDIDAVFCKKCGSKKFASGSKPAPVVTTEDRSQATTTDGTDDAETTNEKDANEASGAADEELAMLGNRSDASLEAKS